MPKAAAKFTIKTGTVLTDLDGEPMQEKDVDLTLGRVLSAALVAPTEKKLKPIDAMDRYELAMDLRKNPEMSLTPEQIIMCKDAICAIYPAIYSGQVCCMLQ